MATRTSGGAAPAAVRRLLAVAGSVPLVACAGAQRRPLVPTDAATQLEQVTRSRENELDPAISPDGGSLAYEVVANPGATPRVEVMSLAGRASGDAGKIDYSTGALAGTEPAWLPDGSGLLFVGPSGGSSSLFEVARVGPGRGASFVPAGPLGFSGGWPSVSPDGSAVAMSVGAVREFETGWRTARQLDDALGVLGLSPDPQAGARGLAGTGVTLLGDGSQPAWSPDGRHLAFVRATDGRAHLFVGDADGRHARQITDGSADDREPSWAPDGSRIVFCSAHATEGALTANLFTVAPNGDGLVQLTEGDGEACRPAWGRDGFVYFHANARDRFHIWRIRPNG